MTWQAIDHENERLIALGAIFTPIINKKAFNISVLKALRSISLEVDWLLKLIAGDFDDGVSSCAGAAGKDEGFQGLIL